MLRGRDDRRHRSRRAGQVAGHRHRALVGASGRHEEERPAGEQVRPRGHKTLAGRPGHRMAAHDPRRRGSGSGEGGDVAFQAADIHEDGVARAAREGPQRRHDVRLRRRHDDDIRVEEVLELRDRGDVPGPGRVERANVVVLTQRKGDRSADEPAPGDADAHQTGAATGRPTAPAIAGSSDISFSKFSKVSDWKPSLSA